MSVPSPRACAPAPARPMGSRAAALRAEFDASFAAPVNPDTTAWIDVLTFRVGEELYGIDLAQVTEMSARPLITPVPARVAALHGLAAAHGQVVAAYDVSRLIGGPGELPRWMIVPAAQPSVGLTFEHFEGHRRVPSASAGHADGTAADPGRLIAVNDLLDAVRTLNHVVSQRFGEQS